ncbi:MAG: hypothetical protein O7B23_05965, partial [Deltaproteobacteria bacterium]|nr:hypothetical protein [Deltaproteobacteria bacterium]
MRQFLSASLLAAALLLAAGPGYADAFESFYLDPARSHMSVTGGSISAQLSTTDFAFADLTPQPGANPTPLSGQFVMQVGGDLANPTFWRILSGTADIRPADSNLLSPAQGGAAGLVDAAFGVSFLDTATGLGGDVAIHDMVFGAVGVFSIFPNGLGPLGLQGDLEWTLAAGILEISTNIGIGGTAFAPNTVSLVNAVFRNESQYSEVSPGVYEVVIPFLFSL